MSPAGSFAEASLPCRAPLRQRPALGAALAAGLGLIHTAAFAPFECWWLQILALAGLAWSVRRASLRAAAWKAWWFGIGWLASGLWWLYISLHDYGGLPAPLAMLAVFALAAFLALYPALAISAYAAARGRSAVANGLLFAGCWLAAELARGTWFSGFPWIASGYAHTSGPLAPLAPWIGVYGISAAAALLAAAAAEAWALCRPEAVGPARQIRPAAALLGMALVLPTLACFGPASFTGSTGRLSVSLLQPNVAQDLKFDPQHLAEHLDQLRTQVLEARGRLVVTPESVVPLPQADLDPDTWASLVAPFRQSDRGLLIGTFLGDDAEGYVNSMVGLSARGAEISQAYHYGKRHLLPFGEYVPAGFRWFVNLLRIPLGDQASGRTQALFVLQGQRVRPLICYEDLFGEEFAGSTLGPQGATVLANASNLAWFGPWMMQDQHLQFSRMRAMEFQRPLIRATNTGATAVIDHHGAVLARLPGGQTGILEAEVEGRSGDTPYAVWVARWGLAPAWGLALLLAAPAVGLALSRRSGT